MPGAKEEQAERSRQALRAAAAALFAERGYQGATVQAIGERAGVSRGSIFYHFGSKEGLLWAVVEDVFGKWVDRQLLQDVGTARGLAAVSRAVESHKEMLSRERDILRLYYVLMFEGMGPRPELAPTFVAIHRQFREYAQRFLHDARDAGETRRDLDVPATARALTAALGGLGYHWLLDPEDVDLDAAYAAFSDVAVAGLRR